MPCSSSFASSGIDARSPSTRCATVAACGDLYRSSLRSMSCTISAIRRDVHVANAEPIFEHLERAEIALMPEAAGLIHVERHCVGISVRRHRERERRLPIDEPPDEPCRGEPVHAGPRPGDPHAIAIGSRDRAAPARARLAVSIPKADVRCSAWPSSPSIHPGCSARLPRSSTTP